MIRWSRYSAQTGKRGEPEPFNLSGIPGDNKDGFAAEVVSERASAFTKIPEGYSLSEAATLPCAAPYCLACIDVQSQNKAW